ncbi:hypothetical protein K1719_008752 [Acacia pycnantha]|nr:hypothetical protein K1719_008752 [Acacia pycnantha]
MGRFGGAFAIGTSYWLNVFILALYMKFSDSCAKTRVSISMEIFHGIGEFFRFAIPSVIMICFQWWSYEVGTLLAGLLRPNPELETSILAVCVSKSPWLKLWFVSLMVNTEGVAKEVDGGGETFSNRGGGVKVGDFGVHYTLLADLQRPNPKHETSVLTLWHRLFLNVSVSKRKKHVVAKKLNLDDLVDVPIGMARMEGKWLKPMEWTVVSFKANENRLGGWQEAATKGL